MLRRSRFCCTRPLDVRRTSSKLHHYDVCVIGAGPAGVAAALRAVDYGKRVCLVEANRVGGCDLWNGALQSKTLWEMSKYVSSLSGEAARRIFSNVSVKEIQKMVDLSRVQETLQHVSTKRENQILEGLAAAGVKTVFGRALFSSPHELDVRSPGTSEFHVLTADYFVIATGSLPRRHDFVKVDSRCVVTTDTIMQLPIPSSLVIIGAGAVGCEFASIFANFGCTDVSLVDCMSRILPREDEDIAEFVEKSLERRGVKILHTCTLFDLEAREGGPQVGGCIYSVRRNTKRTDRCGGLDVIGDVGATHAVETYESERALIAVGRIPNISSLGLENTACKVTDGRLALDAFNRCLPHNHIYAVGDACADRGLVNLGEAQGRGAIDHMFSGKVRYPINSSVLTNLSTILFLEEEVGCVGLNEMQCRAQGVGYIVARFNNSHLSRAIAMGDVQGFCKVIVTNDREKRLLGVRAVGAHAGSIVEVASLAIRQNDSAYSLLKLTAAYPAVVQGFVECIRMILGRSGMKPNTTPNATLHVWHPQHTGGGSNNLDGVALPLVDQAQEQRKWEAGCQVEVEMERRRQSVVDKVIKSESVAQEAGVKGDGGGCNANGSNQL
ncbi:Pyridine nucleotide disulfide oxidoreductase FAD binding domain [Trypanosoma vivax]|uniref:Putative dihydrolipoamide dehydrogenase n=1 Tax=Trypanosoma vivax (strain Y486) TaxID=1055687 RepID=G0TZQ2_TRYVY|nr:putative dihydrolipoamide dehydrogenase [Trypanosoma vivax]KAH8617590.1 Pyridine nucleotide disulfide oxidoreductase FAD binding domain [Trypanosoma vivax]CCC50080.1 putative dihydrolipoamide dehydrogenase [Trypanosoma vivax Y486]